MIDYLPGFERRLRGNNGGYETAGPWSLLLHTTEGGLLGSIGTLDARNVWPQLLVDFELGRRIQAYPLSMPGRSLADRAGGVFTNRRGRVIQVEIVGFARQSHLWGDGAYRFLADVLRPVFDGGVGAHGPRFFGEGEGLLASPNAHQRFPFGVWNGFGGVCGHQHAPENDHWDPGRFDLARFLRFVGAPGPAPQPKPPALEDDMLAAVQCTEPGDGWPEWSLWPIGQAFYVPVDGATALKKIAAGAPHLKRNRRQYHGNLLGRDPGSWEALPGVAVLG